LRGRKTASLPFFAFRFLLRKNLGNLFPPASMPAIRGGLRHWILPAAKSISPPAAESRFTALAAAHTAVMLLC
jgi:hypothetical protein